MAVTVVVEPLCTLLWPLALLLLLVGVFLLIDVLPAAGDGADGADGCGLRPLSGHAG